MSGRDPSFINFIADIYVLESSETLLHNGQTSNGFSSSRTPNPEEQFLPQENLTRFLSASETKTDETFVRVFFLGRE